MQRDKGIPGYGKSDRQNLNRTAKFVGAILKGGASEEQIVRTYREIIQCKDFVLSLIKIYRNTPHSV